MITAKQIRAARALLNWRQKDLATLSGLTNVTIANIESEQNGIRLNSIELIEKALVKAGVNFLGVDGVSLSEGVVKIYEGLEEFKKFFNELYEQFKIKGGIVRVSGVKEENFIKYLGDEFATMHTTRVAKLDIKFKVLIGKDDGTLRCSYAFYKEIPKEFFLALPCYIYDNTVSHIIWDKHIKVVSIKNEDLAKAQSLQFELIWNQLDDSKTNN